MSPKIGQLAKAPDGDFLGRFREVISDPLNLLISRVPLAGHVEGDLVYLHNGLKVPVSGPNAYYGSFSQLLVVNRGVHEPLEEFVFQEVLKRVPNDATMIELGAYWGHYSMWFKKEKTNSQAILVEADANFSKIGQANFERNGFRGEFIQAFVGKGKLELDSFFKTRKFKLIDILHADIQGYEVEMLAGAENVLNSRRVNYLFVSTHSQAIHASVTTSLAEKGYRVEISSDFENQTTSFDGFVLATSPNVPPVFDQTSILGRTAIAHAGPAELLNSIATLRNRLPG